MSSETLTAVIGQVGLFLSTLAATYIGAWAAFRLERAHSLRSTESAQAAAVREALFILATQYSILRNLVDQALAPLRDSPLRVFELKPFTAYGPYPSISPSSLLFLLESADPDILNQTYLAERRFLSAMGILDQRNAFHVRGQELLAAQAPRPDELAVVQVHAILGPALLADLTASTNGLYQAVDDALAQNRSVTTSLETFLSNQYPGHRKLTISVLPSVRQ